MDRPFLDAQTGGTQQTARKSANTVMNVRIRTQSALGAVTNVSCWMCRVAGFTTSSAQIAAGAASPVGTQNSATDSGSGPRFAPMRRSLAEARDAEEGRRFGPLDEAGRRFDGLKFVDELVQQALRSSPAQVDDNAFGLKYKLTQQLHKQNRKGQVLT